MFQSLEEIKHKDMTFKVDIVKSDLESIDGDCCYVSALSQKALIRISEKNQNLIFYNPYGEGKHLYDFECKNDYNEFINNNKYKIYTGCNDYFILVFADIEVDDSTNRIAETNDNIRIINSVIKKVLDNI